jgi:YesN/AraC family two-component response regulator
VQLVYEKEETQEETSSEDFPELLIIEDNPDVVLYIKSILQNEYRIHIAENGNLGIEKALEFIPDIIISDVMMPEKDGYEVCEILKQDERTSHIPIILLTAKSTREDKLEGLKYGADAFLTKPFDKEELLIRLRKLIDTRQKIQTHFQKSIISSNLTNKEQTPPKTESLEDRFLKRLNAILHQNISDETFGIEELCEAMQISRVQLHRKLKALTNLSTSIYIRQVRLLKAQELLQNTEMNISEVAYAVGFKDPAYFTRKFTEVFGKPPRESRIS